MSEPCAPDLRTLLRDAEPKDFSHKKAWRRVIQVLRAHKKATSESGTLSSLGSVERALGTVLPRAVDVSEIKRLLKQVLVADEPTAAACRLDSLVSQLLPVTRSAPVLVDVEGWPEDFGPALRARLLRLESGLPVELEPPVAAALVREFDGYVLAGSRLSVKPQLGPGEVLPSIPRAMRARPMPRGRKGPWLPHWDSEGRRFLTPEPLARRQAQRLSDLGASQVIDGCAGLGGNSIAFAEAGLSVLAVESDPSRLALARRNADARGLGDRITWRCGRIESLLSELPEWPLFLDPPWDPESGGLPDWLPFPDGRVLVLKTPGSFDPKALRGESWTVCYDFGGGEDDGFVLKMLTILRS